MLPCGKEISNLVFFGSFDQPNRRLDKNRAAIPRKNVVCDWSESYLKTNRTY